MPSRVTSVHDDGTLDVVELKNNQSHRRIPLSILMHLPGSELLAPLSAVVPPKVDQLNPKLSQLNPNMSQFKKKIF